MMRRMKVLCLAAVACMAFVAFGATVASADESTLLEKLASSGDGMAPLLLASGIAALGVLRIGKWQQFSFNALLTHSHITTSTTNQFAITTGTGESKLRGAAFTARQLPTASEDAPTSVNAQLNPNLNERDAWTFNPVTAC